MHEDSSDCLEGHEAKMKEIIKDYDKIRLADGRTGQVDEVLGDQELFIVDVDVGKFEWETEEFKRDDILEVID